MRKYKIYDIDNNIYLGNIRYKKLNINNFFNHYSFYQVQNKIDRFNKPIYKLHKGVKVLYQVELKIKNTLFVKKVNYKQFTEYMINNQKE